MTLAQSGLCLAAIATALASPAWGQELAADDGRLDEIVVTAQKREQNLQDVPISIAAFSAEQVRERGLSRPMDIGYQVPGLVAKSPNGDNSPLFTIRGIGVTDFTVGNNSPTSIYVDQVIKPYYPMVNFSLYDIERVEVLKGPQGTLYGRNNTGGAIKFITRRPSRTFEGFLRAEYARFDTLEVEGGVGGPINETLSARISGFTRQRNEGWQYNVLTGEKNGEVDRLAGRLALQWEPSSAITANLTVYAGRNHSDVPQFKLAPPFSAANPSQICAAAARGERARDGSCVDILGHFDPDPNTRHVQTANVQGSGIREDGQGGVLTIDADLGFATLSSVTGYDHQDRREFQDFDGTPSILVDNSFTQHLKSFTQETRLAANKDAPVQWVGGLFYSTDRVDNLQILRGDALFASPTPVKTNVSWKMRTKSYAAFGQVEVPLAETITVLGGLRATHEKRTFAGGTLPEHSFFPTVVVDNRVSFDDLSGKIGINYRPNDDLMIYASASRGFKSGGFNGGFATNALAYAPYGKEVLYAYELGFKSQPLPSLRFNASVYYYDWKDFQATVTRTDPATNIPTQVLGNAGTAHIKGIEAELNWRPFRGLNVALSGNATDADIVSGIYEGRRIGNTPKFSMAGSVRYEVPVDALGGSVYGLVDYNYRTRYPLRLVTPTTRPLVFQDAFWLVNARLGYRMSDPAIEVSAFVKNLFDKSYLTEVFDQGSFNTLDLYAEPRTYGVTVTYRF